MFRSGESITREARLDSVKLESEMYCMLLLVVLVNDNCTRPSPVYLLCRGSLQLPIS